jgi:hypothetical protein
MPDEKPPCCARCLWWLPGEDGWGWCDRKGVGSWKAVPQGKWKAGYDDVVTDANAICRLFDRKPERRSRS